MSASFNELYFMPEMPELSEVNAVLNCYTVCSSQSETFSGHLSQYTTGIRHENEEVCIQVRCQRLPGALEPWIPGYLEPRRPRTLNLEPCNPEPSTLVPWKRHMALRSGHFCSLAFMEPLSMKLDSLTQILSSRVMLLLS